jgi:oligosaccharide repeat unit polymerase
MKKSISGFYIFFMPLIFFISLLQGNIASGKINFLPIIIFFLFFYVCTVIKAIYFYGIISLYPLYLYTAFFFIYSRFYFHLIGYKPFSTIEFPISYYFSDKVGIIFISVIFISHYIIDGVICYHPLPMIKSNALQHSPFFEYWGFIFMLYSFPFIIYKLYLRLLYVKEYGYLAIYSGRYPEIDLPIWTKGSGTIFLIGYLMVLCSYPSNKKYILASVIFLLYSLVGSLRGGRGEFITYIITVIYIYYKFYHKKISLNKIIIVFLFITVFSILIGTSREEPTKNNIKINDLVEYFFYNQGNSIGSPLAVIETSGKFKNHSFSFIFSPVFYPYFSFLYPNRGQTQILLEKYNDLGSITTHYLSPTAYFNGNGVGRTFIAEMYDFGGLFGIIFWSVILALLILKTENDFLRNRWCIIFYFGVIKTIIYLPRNVFFVFLETIPYLVGIIFLQSFIHSFKINKK